MAKVTAAALSRFLDGYADVEDGPSGGVIPHRIPAAGRALVADPLFTWAERSAAGVRVLGRTSGERVQLTLRGTTLALPTEDPVPPVVVTRRAGSSEMIALHGSDVLTFDPAAPDISRHPGTDDVLDLLLDPSGRFEVLLPHSSPIEVIALESDGELAPVADTRRSWTHYGSSISHSVIAANPQAVWVQQVADQWDVRLRNLSLSGNAQLDGFAGRLIAETPSDLITLAVGINVVNSDSMRERAFIPAVHAFLDLIRERQPTTPVVLIGGVICPIHEDAPGPVVQTEAGGFRAAVRQLEFDPEPLTLGRTRQILQEAVALREDPELHYVDGRDFFGLADAAMLYDDLHPDRVGNELLAARVLARWPLFPA